MHKQNEVPAILSFRGVSKSFRSKTVIQDMDLAVRPGEIFGFLGPNGAGKTTAIKLLLDILRPTEGVIELFGASNQLTAAAHARLGYLSGDMVLDDDLTGRQYLSFVGQSYGGDYTTRQDELVHLLQADLNVKIGNYSRGNKQKVGLIAALMHQQELLVLDEPSSGFDPLIQDVFIHLIEEYRQAGGTVFMSSHTLSEVQKLCDRVAFIRGGKIVGVVDVDELNRTALKQVRVVAAAGVIARLKQSHQPGLKLLESTHDRLTFTYSGAMQPLLLVLATHELEDLTIEEPDLEAIFMSYYDDAKVSSK